MYNEFYGFSEKPFELTPDPGFFFLTPSHRTAIASIINGIRNRRGFISITGEVGTGKTALVHFLLNKLDVEEKVKTVFIFHTTITFKELLKNIFLELNLEVVETSKKTLLRHLSEYLTQLIAQDETLVLLIDEAQDLPEDVMVELGMFTLSPRPELGPKVKPQSSGRGVEGVTKPEVLQIIFVGQPEFEDKLNSQGLRQLQQRIAIRHQIRALSEEETRDYIDHRLRLVGSSSSQRFTPKALSMICSYARGIPRIINILCDKAFLIGYLSSQKMIDDDIMQKVIKGIGSSIL